MKPRRILGIDPGSQHLGLALIEKKGPDVRLLFAEIIHAPPSKDLYLRLDHLLEKLRRRVEELAPEEVAIEDTFFAKNARSAFRLGMARGVAVAACLGRGITIYEYAPTQVKSVVTGYGRADKAQVKKMVGLTFGAATQRLEIDELGYDATDAIAVALCHAHLFQLGALARC